MFQTKVVEKVKAHKSTHFMFSNILQKIVLWDNVEKCGRARKASDNNITGCMHFACWVTKARDICRILNICGFCTAATFTWTNSWPPCEFCLWHWAKEEFCLSRPRSMDET